MKPRHMADYRRLFADALLSLWRQWALRPEFRQQSEAISAVAPDGVPIFYVGARDTPRPIALIYGGVLSLAVFSAVCLHT